MDDNIIAFTHIRLFKVLPGKNCIINVFFFGFTKIGF